MRPTTEEQLQRLPVLQPADLKVAARAFKVRAGVGADGVHPRALTCLFDEGASAALQMLSLIESKRLWPQRLNHAWYFSIPKLGGGLQQIGLLPSVARLWERLRRPLIASRMQQQAHNYDWAAVGKTVESTAWQQLVLSEVVDTGQDEKNLLVVV